MSERRPNRQPQIFTALPGEVLPPNGAMVPVHSATANALQARRYDPNEISSKISSHGAVIDHQPRLRRLQENILSAEPVDLETRDRARRIVAASIESPYTTVADAEETPNSPTASYLKDIGPIPLLKAAEEVFLAKQIEEGKKAHQELEKPDLDTHDRELLEAAIAKGEAARTKLTISNLKLAVSIAKKYFGLGVPLPDLIQEGNIGLLRAVEKFDWRRGFRFSTYATWWIRQAITRALTNDLRTIRLPVHFWGLLSETYGAIRDLQQELGTEPTPADITQKLGISVVRLEEILRVSKAAISLETLIYDHEGSEGGTLEDTVSDGNTVDPEEYAVKKTYAEPIEKALETLTPYQRIVLRLRFGLDRDGVGRTLQEVGDELGVSRERVRQIEAEALQELRRPMNAGKLRELYN